mmetsp:Transcript_24657/g.57252  ORF Transcript_24657/g.57252 Transcript_24657/m.57252 type:complete len:256 (-) Transcript_24657:61-828(-)
MQAVDFHVALTVRTKAWSQLQLLTGKLATWSTWMLIVVVIAAPSVTHSAVKTIPGFLRLLPWLLSNGISMLAVLLTTFVLPYLAALVTKHMPRYAREEELAAVARLLNAWLVPCTVAILLGSSCIGYWTSWWEPCLSERSLLDITVVLQFRPWFDETTSRSVLEEIRPEVRSFKLLSREDVCSATAEHHALLRPGKCAESILDLMSQLLLGLLLKTIFLGPSVQLLRGRAMRSVSAWVLIMRWTIGTEHVMMSSR